MKTPSDSRYTKKTESTVEPFDIFIGCVVVLILAPFGIAILASLWGQSDAGLGWAIFIFGLALIFKYHEQGKMSCFLGTVCSIALMTALWNQSMVATGIIVIITIFIEVFQFTKEESPKNS